MYGPYEREIGKTEMGHIRTETKEEKNIMKYWESTFRIFMITLAYSERS